MYPYNTGSQGHPPNINAPSGPPYYNPAPQPQQDYNPFLPSVAPEGVNFTSVALGTQQQRHLLLKQKMAGGSSPTSLSSSAPPPLPPHQPSPQSAPYTPPLPQRNHPQQFSYQAPSTQLYSPPASPSPQPPPPVPQRTYLQQEQQPPPQLPPPPQPARTYQSPQPSLGFSAPLPQRGGTSFGSQPVSVPMFGSDPSSLPTVEDKGFKVPVVLSIFRQALYTKGGLSTEGIFRLSGNESLMKQIQRNPPTDPSCQLNIDVHSAATLIKRWYSELPSRLLSPAALSSQDLEGFASGSKSIKTLPDSLSEPYRSLFLWLSAVLSDVLRHEKENKMGQHNLVLMFSPILAPTGGNPIEDMGIAAKAGNTLRRYLEATVA